MPIGYSIDQTSSITEIPARSIRRQAAAGMIPDAVKISGSWIIPAGTTVWQGVFFSLVESKSDMKYVGTREAAKMAGYGIRRMQQLCQSGSIPGVKKVAGIWMVPTMSDKILWKSCV